MWFFGLRLPSAGIRGVPHHTSYVVLKTGPWGVSRPQWNWQEMTRSSEEDGAGWTFPEAKQDAVFGNGGSMLISRGLIETLSPNQSRGYSIAGLWGPRNGAAALGHG